MPKDYMNGRYLVFKGNGNDGAPLGRIHRDGIVRGHSGEPLYCINEDAFCSIDFIFLGHLLEARDGPITSELLQS